MRSFVKTLRRRLSQRACVLEAPDLSHRRAACWDDAPKTTDSSGLPLPGVRYEVGTLGRGFFVNAPSLTRTHMAPFCTDLC